MPSLLVRRHPEYFVAGKSCNIMLKLCTIINNPGILNVLFKTNGSSCHIGGKNEKEKKEKKEKKPFKCRFCLLLATFPAHWRTRQQHNIMIMA